MAIACTKVKGTAPGGFSPKTLFGEKRENGNIYGAHILIAALNRIKTIVPPCLGLFNNVHLPWDIDQNLWNRFIITAININQ